MIEIGIDAAQTAVLCGIFWRMGGFNAVIGDLKNRVNKLETKMERLHGLV